MEPARYIIQQDGEAWIICYGGERFGPYRTKDEAMVFALDAARKLDQDGTAVEVCLAGENGHIRTEWPPAETPTAKEA